MLTGIDAIYGVRLKKDEKGNIEYDNANVIKIGDAIDVSVKKKYVSGKQYASDILKNNVNRLTEVTLEINTDDIKIDVEAMLQGYLIEKGGYTETSDEKQVYFAYMIKGAVSEDNYSYVTLYKGIASIEEENFKSKKDAVEFLNRKIKITCTANADGKIMDKRRSDAADFEESIKEEWNKYPYGYKSKI